MIMIMIKTMINQLCRWVEKEKLNKSCKDGAKFQTDYVNVLVNDCGSDYPYDLDVTEMFYTWLDHKKDNIVTYRDQSFASKFTGSLATNLKNSASLIFLSAYTHE